MARVIKLTDPYMHGADVKTLQRALTVGKYGDFRPGAIDGVAGPKTCDAIRRAKFKLGYLRVNRRAGSLLLARLTGDRPLTAAMKTRRLKRLTTKPITEKSLREKAYQVAVAEIGHRESSYNVCKYTIWWFRKHKWAVGWCSIFASYCYKKAGSKVFRSCTVVGGKLISEGYTDYSEQILADAIAGKNGMSIVKNPERGDWVVWQWDTGATDHSSILESCTSSTVVSIDGNVPDVVKRCTRSRGSVRAFIRITK